MEREEGGWFRMGNTCKPVVDSFRYMAKPVQYYKVKKKRIKKKIQRSFHVTCSGQTMESRAH